MDEVILKKFFEDIKKETPNYYSNDIQTDLLPKAKEELTKLKIPFVDITSKLNSIRLFPNEKYSRIYTKGFYLNNSHLGNLICKDKFLTQRFLENSKIKTPIGKMFKPNEYDYAFKFIDNNLNKKYVLKPVSMSMSLGTFLNVDTSNLKNAWDNSFKVQENYKITNPRVLIQEKIEGLELRIIILEGKIGTAVFRGPGNIVGDGKSTIEQLIKTKNLQRNKHNYLKRNPLVINSNLIQNLESKNLTLDSVLDKNEYCILYSQSSIATGREVFEVSKYLHKNIFDQALKAVTAIPGAHTAGVDIFVDDLHAEQGTIIEVNLNPALQLHYYPMTGKQSSPLFDIFESQKVERELLNDELKYEELTKNDFDILTARYKFLYEKQKNLSKSFKNFINI